MKTSAMCSPPGTVAVTVVPPNRPMSRTTAASGAGNSGVRSRLLFSEPHQRQHLPLGRHRARIDPLDDPDAHVRETGRAPFVVDIQRETRVRPLPEPSSNDQPCPACDAPPKSTSDLPHDLSRSPR